MPDYEHLTSLQLTEIRETWLRQCGPVEVEDQEHANRVSGGFGCGRDGCPPAPTGVVGTWLG